MHFTEHYKEEMREEKRVGRMHLVSDTISLTVAGIVLRTRREGFILLRNLTGRVSKGLSQTAKAFMLILIADILMGYHSEEAWTSSIELITEHYSLEPEVRAPRRLVLCAVGSFVGRRFVFQASLACALANRATGFARK